MTTRYQEFIATRAMYWASHLNHDNKSIAFWRKQGNYQQACKADALKARHELYIMDYAEKLMKDLQDNV